MSYLISINECDYTLLQGHQFGDGTGTGYGSKRGEGYGAGTGSGAGSGNGIGIGIETGNSSVGYSGHGVDSHYDNPFGTGSKNGSGAG